MRRCRFHEEKIIQILKEGDSGVPPNIICHKYNISQGSYYKWKKRYGSLNISEVKKVNQLETLNRRLKKLYMRSRMENRILQEAIEGKL